MSVHPTDLKPRTKEVEMTEQLQAPRRVPRALTPFRHAGYRRLALALVLSSFASGVWIVALVWEVIRIGGGPAQLSVGHHRQRRRRAAARPPGRRGRRPGPAEADPARRRDRGAHRHDAGRRALAHRHHPDLAPGRGLVRDRCRRWPSTTRRTPRGCRRSCPSPTCSRSTASRAWSGRPSARRSAPAWPVSWSASSRPAPPSSVAATASLFALLALATVPLTPVRRDLAALAVGHPVASAVRDMREGFGYMVRTPWLLSSLLFVSLMLLLIMGPFEVLIPFLIKGRLAGGPGDHAIVMAAFGIGGALGSLGMASVRMPRRYLTLMNLMWGVGCLPLVAIGFAPSVAVVVVAAFVLGAMFSAPMVIWGTLLQTRVPAHMLGRVASLDFFVSVSLMPISMALAGPVSEAIGIRTTFLVAGIVPGVLAALAIWLFRLPQDEITHPLASSGETAPDIEPDIDPYPEPELAGCVA